MRQEGTGKLICLVCNTWSVSFITEEDMNGAIDLFEDHKEREHGADLEVARLQNEVLYWRNEAKWWENRYRNDYDSANGVDWDDV